MRKRKVNFKDPKTGKVEIVELWSVDADDAVKRVPWEYSYGTTFAERPADAPDPFAKPEVAPGLGAAAAPLPAPVEPTAPVKRAKPAPVPAPAPDLTDEKAKKRALVEEYKLLTGKKDGAFKSVADLEAAIAAEKDKKNSGAGGGAQGGDGNV